ncbi:MAG TPA: single-stranded DNA-binding protein [Armatimonadaceae bacterium]|jgi:single-strand DNA-binding protein|nr:single-stranded DNA-binding protein [Armatimonadaceae bacterium]
MLNRVVLIGRLATEPELKYTPSGIAVTQFRLAVGRPLSAEARAQGNEPQADFIDIVAWRQNAEYAANYLSKGRLVAVEGRLQIREYVDREGQRRRAAEIVSDNIKGLDRPKDQEGEGGGGGGGYEHQSQDREQRPPQRAAAPAAERGAGPASGAGGGARGRQAAPPANDFEDMDGFDDPFAE